MTTAEIIYSMVQQQLYYWNKFNYNPVESMDMPGLPDNADITALDDLFLDITYKLADMITPEMIEKEINKLQKGTL
jgi:hypothetical protein